MLETLGNAELAAIIRALPLPEQYRARLICTRLRDVANATIDAVEVRCRPHPDAAARKHWVAGTIIGLRTIVFDGRVLRSWLPSAIQRVFGAYAVVRSDLHSVVPSSSEVEQFDPVRFESATVTMHAYATAAQLVAAGRLSGGLHVAFCGVDGVADDGAAAMYETAASIEGVLMSPSVFLLWSDRHLDVLREILTRARSVRAVSMSGYRAGRRLDVAAVVLKGKVLDRFVTDYWEDDDAMREVFGMLRARAMEIRLGSKLPLEALRTALDRGQPSEELHIRTYENAAAVPALIELLEHGSPFASMISTAWSAVTLPWDGRDGLLRSLLDAFMLGSGSVDLSLEVAQNSLCDDAALAAFTRSCSGAGGRAVHTLRLVTWVRTGQMGGVDACKFEKTARACADEGVRLVL